MEFLVHSFFQEYFKDRLIPILYAMGSILRRSDMPICWGIYRGRTAESSFSKMYKPQLQDTTEQWESTQSNMD